MLVNNFPKLDTDLSAASFPSPYDVLVSAIIRGVTSNIHMEKNISRVSDLVMLESDFVRKLPGIGKKKVSLFETLKDIYTSEPDQEQVKEEGCEGSIIDAVLDEVFFYNEYDKLIKRVKNNLEEFSKDGYQINTLRDLVELSSTELMSVRGMGRTYVNLHNKLREFIGIKGCRCSSSVLGGYYDHEIIVSSLDSFEQKFIKRYFDYDLTVGELFGVNTRQQKYKRGFGKSSPIALYNIQEKIRVEINKIESGEINLDLCESRLVMPSSDLVLSFEQLEDILLVDIDAYLDTLDDKSQYIFQSRWGFFEDKASLQVLGDTYELTRERVRQLESHLNNGLVHFIRISSRHINGIIIDSVSYDLRNKMMDLYDCFVEEKDFFKFIGYISGVNNIIDRVYPDVGLNVLDTMFAENGVQCDHAGIISYLDRFIGVDEYDYNSIIHYLKNKGVIELKENIVTPLNLPKREAAAAVLYDHPRGLPWLDLAKIVNSLKISKSKFYEDRTMSTTLTGSEFIYLSGKGVLCHTRHIDYSQIDIDKIFDSLLVYYSNVGKDHFHLNQVYQMDSFLQSLDYYQLRYIVISRGSEYGFYFYGKSSVDTVSVNEDKKSVTQEDVIVDALNQSKKLMTKAEIASLLKSNSIGHATFYLDKMSSSNMVVQPENMLYTTPDIAYDGIDLERVRFEIYEIIKNERKLVHFSFFGAILNKKLSTSYSDQFFFSIAKYYSNLGEWYRSGSLFSLYEVSYSSLADLIRINCNSDISISKNVTKVTDLVSIDAETVRNSIYSYRVYNSKVST